MRALALLAALSAAPDADVVDRPRDPGTPQAKRDAKAAYARARDDAAQGRYADAIVGFEQALALYPSPGLHYNIAVCHHRLMLGAEPKSEDHERHRAEAVNAYNAYLDAAPDADDRYAVAATIQDLRGRPNLIDDWTIDDEDPGRASLELRDAAPDEPEEAKDTSEPEPLPTPVRPTDPAMFDPAPAKRADLPSQRSPMRAGFPHGMMGLGLSIDAPAPAAMAGSAGIDSAPALGPVIRGGGFVGRARAVLVGAELAWATTTTPARRGHRLTTGSVSVLVDWARTLGATKRLDLGVSSTLGLGGQSLAHDGPSPAMCPVRSSGVVSTRGGLLAGARFLLRVTLGRRRQHAIALRTGPTGTLFGGGTKGSNCTDNAPDPFSEYDAPGTGLVVRTDVGYALRW